MKTEIDFDKVLTPGEAASRLGCTRTNVNTMVRQGRLNPIWTPLGRLYDVKEVARVAKAMQKNPRSWWNARPMPS